MNFDPRPYTLRELFLMVEGLSRERWEHTSLACALFANANRDPKKGRALQPRDFNPHARGSSEEVAGDLSDVREALEARKTK